MLASIKKELENRKAPDTARTTLHLRHIKEQLEGTGAFSLEHLEIYQMFLERLIPPRQSASKGCFPADLAEERDRLLHLVVEELKKHPLADKPRSGDKAGGELGYAYVKVPMGRRRQMLVMLYLNLLTGLSLLLSRGWQ